MTTNLRTSTNFRVRAYDATSIPQPNSAYYCVPDDLSDLVVPNHGTTAAAQNTGFRTPGANNTANTISGQPLFNAPADNPSLPALSELTFCLLGARGGRAYFGDHAVTMARTEGGLFGVLLIVREAHNDSVLSPAVAGDPTGSGGSPALDKLLWKIQSGAGWHTVTPLHGPPSTKVMLRDPTTALASIVTVADLVPDQSFRLDFDFAGSVMGVNNGYVAAPWCGAKRLIWRENAHPCYEVWTADERGAGWKTIREFTELPKMNARGRHAQHWSAWVRIIAGHLVLTFQCAGGAHLSFDIIDPQPTSVPQPGSPNPTNYIAHPVTWGAGTLTVQSQGIRVSVGVALLQYAKILQYDGVAAPLVGKFSRTLWTRRRPPGGVTVTNPPGQGGYTRPQDTFHGSVLDSSWSDHNTGGNFNYTVTLTGDVFTGLSGGLTTYVYGVHSPFVTGVIARSVAGSTRKTGPYLDITRACVGDWDIDSAEPPDMVVGELRLTVDRDFLRGMVGDNSWTDYVQQFNIITFEVQDVFEDHSTQPATRSVGSFVQIFEGHNFSPTDNWGGANDAERTLTIRDFMQRTVKPAAFIGEEWDAPLDEIILATQLDFHGSTGWREILRRALGDWAADDLNGGIGNDLLYYPLHYPPLYSRDKDTVGLYQGVVPLEGVWVAPPKYGADANGWGADLQTMEFASRYYGLNPEGTATCFIYGHTTSLYKAARVVGDGAGVNYYIPDIDYVDGDVNKAALEMQRQQMGDFAYNDFRAWGQREAVEVLKPSFVSGHSRLPSTDPNAQEKSWMRTQLLEPKFLDYATSDDAQILTDTLMEEFRDRDPAKGSITTRGYALARLYMVIQLQLTGPHSDVTIGLNGIPLRTRRYGHKGNFDDKTFNTVWYFRTLTHSGF